MFLHILFIVLSVTTLSDATPLGGYRQRGLNPDRAPDAALESKIYSAATCRDNYRIASKITTTQLAYVINASSMCAQAAMFGIKYRVFAQNLTAFQLRLFTEYGYTVVKIADNEEGKPQYNVTWRLYV